MSAREALSPELLAARLGHVFADASLLESALTHPSFASEHERGRGNERLEFLGDAVVGLVIGQLLFETHPTWDEGHLTRARAALVNQRSLAGHARELELGLAVRLGRTEQTGGGAEKDSILANVFEAVLGALYLDGGLVPVFAFARRAFAERLASGDAVLTPDPKTHFQEWAHARFHSTPRYRSAGDSGVEDAPDRFAAEVLLEGEVWGSGTGRTKRAAEGEAAARALERAERGDE